jgi:hypothetical protein
MDDSKLSWDEHHAEVGRMMTFLKDNGIEFYFHQTNYIMTITQEEINYIKLLNPDYMIEDDT